MKRTDADKQRIINRLKDEAKPASNGDLYIRASHACRIIGVTDNQGSAWVRRGKIRPLRFKVKPCPAAPNGRIVAWPIQQAIECAKHYRPMWSTEEDDFLTEHLGRKPMTWIGERLGRTERAVRHRTHHLGVNKYNAQGLMTTGVVAMLCRRTRSAVNYWCFEKQPPLRHQRLTFGKREKMISIKNLVKFLGAHPGIENKLPEASRRAISRMAKDVITRSHSSGHSKPEPKISQTPSGRAAA